MIKSNSGSCCYVQIFVAFLAFSSLMINTSAAPCHKNFKGQQSGIFTSPNYPNESYPDDQTCTWAITVAQGLIVRLTFKDFLTERNFACSNDYVKVFDGPSETDTMIGKYCGGMQPFDVDSSSNQMFVKFVSDSSVGFRGFRAEFKATVKQITTDEPFVPLLSTTKQSLTSTAPTDSLPTHITATGMHLSQKPETTATATASPTKVVANVPKTVLSFTNPLGNHTVAVGSSQRFVCHVKGTRKRVPIKWTWNGRIISDDPDQIDIWNRPKRKSTLTLKKTKKEDSGMYGCHAGIGMIGVDSIQMYGFLSVKDPPIIVLGPADQNVVTGDHVTMTCTVGGDPPLKIKWYINGIDSSDLATMGQSRTSKITFRAEQTVKVECLVYNDLGRSSAKATASVQRRMPVTTRNMVPRKALITIATLNQTAGIGANVTLRCSATGTPPMKIRWFIDGRYYDGEQNRGRESMYTSSFTFTVNKEYTEVKCLAQNPYGIDNRSGVIRPSEDMEAVSQSPWDQFMPGKSLFYILVVCALATLVLVLLGVVCIRRQRASSRYKPPTPVSLEQLTKNPMFERNSTSSYINPKLERWELYRNNIEFVKDLDDGPLSRLFLGNMAPLSRGEQDVMVMVKVRKESVPSQEIKDAFEEEALVLTTYDHPNVQSLLGVCVIGRPLCLVLEYSDRGDLNQFLRDCGCSHYIIRERPSSAIDPDSNKLSHLDQLCIAKQIAAGMEYLASRGYIHKQLCTKSCIISKNMIVKIANLGVSDAGPNTSYYHLNTIQKSKYPVRWLPLETIHNGIFDDNTDIWSYGIMLWEVYSYGMTPYYGMNNEEVISLVRDGDILPKPKECPREMYSLMQDCWSLVPHERPRFRYLHQKIGALFTGVAV